jgi:hypothetical protein
MHFHIPNRKTCPKLPMYLLLLAIHCFPVPTLSQSAAPDKAVTSKLENSKKVRIFPNPATNVVNILGLENSLKAQISITDITGNKVQGHNWEIRNNSLSIPIPTLVPGIYMVTVQSKEQRFQSKFYKN